MISLILNLMSQLQWFISTDIPTSQIYTSVMTLLTVEYYEYEVRLVSNGVNVHMKSCEHQSCGSSCSYDAYTALSLFKSCSCQWGETDYELWSPMGLLFATHMISYCGEPRQRTEEKTYPRATLYTKNSTGTDPASVMTCCRLTA